MWPQMTSMTITMTFSYPMSCDISNELKSNDFSIRPFNVLDQLEVIWPLHDRKCDFRWPPWPQFCLFYIIFSLLPSLVFDFINQSIQLINNNSSKHGFKLKSFIHVIFIHYSWLFFISKISISQGVVRWPPTGLKLDQSNTEVITFHLLFCLPRNKKKSLLWSWRSSEVTFLVMVRSNDLQFV